MVRAVCCFLVRSIRASNISHLIESTCLHRYGECDGDAQDANFVKHKDHSGNEKVYGSIRVGSDICHIAPNADGDDEIDCAPESDFEQDNEPVEAPEDKHEENGSRQLVFGYTPTSSIVNVTHAMRGSAGSTAGRRLYDDSGANIDVLVVWTNEAECANAGLSEGCTLTLTTTSNMRGRIDLAVAETNIAFDMSGVNTELRLVHAYRDLDYSEPLTDTYVTAVANLRSTTDGKLDSVHSKRTLYGADVVHMIMGEYWIQNLSQTKQGHSPKRFYLFTGKAGSCGIAYSGQPNSNSMFSVSRYICTTGYYSFGHEIAHNLNSQHDRGTVGICGETTYNFGYRDPNAGFRSILAYDCSVGQCDNMPKNGCPRVQRFSNLNSLYSGLPIGSATENNARQINERRSAVASFYPAMNCQRDGECNDDDSTTADTCDLANAVCVFTAASPNLANFAEPLSSDVESQKAIVTASVSSYLESMVVPGVASTAWTTVGLVETYKSPIPVCTVKYGTGATLAPAVVRMQSVGPNSFRIRLQNPAGSSLPARDVHCVVVEEGVWEMPDGRKIEAKKYLSTVTDRRSYWKGQVQTYANSYTSPVVLGQVMTYQDPNWSVFWCHGSKRSKAPSRSQIFTGKHIGEDTTLIRADEIVGYIVFESGHSHLGDIEIETSRGSDSAFEYSQNSQGFTYSFASAFSTKPEVAVVSQVAMDGQDGSWAVLIDAPATAYMMVALDVDQILDNGLQHTSEELDYAVFSAAGSIRLQQTTI